VHNGKGFTRSALEEGIYTTARDLHGGFVNPVGPNRPNKAYIAYLSPV